MCTRRETYLDEIRYLGGVKKEESPIIFSRSFVGVSRVYLFFMFIQVHIISSMLCTHKNMENWAQMHHNTVLSLLNNVLFPIKSSEMYETFELGFGALLDLPIGC